MYSRVRASGLANGWPYQPSTTCGPETPSPRMKRPPERWSMVIAAIAVAAGVRADSCTIAVPRRSRSVARAPPGQRRQHVRAVGLGGPHRVEAQALGLGDRRLDPGRWAGAPVAGVQAELQLARHRATLSHARGARSARAVGTVPAWRRRPAAVKAEAAAHKKEYEKELAGCRSSSSAAGLDRARGPEGRRDLRGARHRGQGRDDQAHHRAHEPARRAHRRPGQAHRARAHAVVLPALRRPPARRRRDGPVRPLLVQPRRRRAGHGLLHAGGDRRSSCAPARSSSARSCARGSSSSSTGSRSATRSRSAASGAHRRPRPRAGSSARWTSRPAPAGSTTPRPRTRCSPSPTRRSARGRWSTPTTSARPA